MGSRVPKRKLVGLQRARLQFKSGTPRHSRASAVTQKGRCRTTSGRRGYTPCPSLSSAHLIVDKAYLLLYSAINYGQGWATPVHSNRLRFWRTRPRGVVMMAFLVIRLDDQHCLFRRQYWHKVYCKLLCLSKVESSYFYDHLYLTQVQAYKLRNIT